jgi:mRNA-degrading endonuclease RelE of RelBE toxin-antitoxin system
VKSWRTSAFRRAFSKLPKAIQRQARQAYKLFSNDPSHPSLQFKKVHPKRPIYSVRIGLGYRALGTKTGDDLVWFWIGSHSEYDRLTS